MSIFNRCLNGKTWADNMHKCVHTRTKCPLTVYASVEGMSMSSFAPLQPASEISAFKGRMNIPAVRERVGLTLGSGIYLVVAVNARKKIVDLISIEGTAYLLEKIPFSALRRMDDAA